MKSIIKKIFLLSLLGLVIVLSSCDNNSDGDKKDDSEVDPRDKYIGTWNVIEKIEDQTEDTYSATIAYATNSAYVEIYNFYFSSSEDDPVNALVTGNTLTISNENACNHTFNGEGKYENGKIIFNYTAKNSTDEFSVTATYE